MTDKIKYFIYEDFYGGYCKDRHEQHVYTDNNKEVYCVYDLSIDCPEDAIIDRDLIDVYDWLDIINYGIQLGKQGYDKANLIKVDHND